MESAILRNLFNLSAKVANTQHDEMFLLNLYILNFKYFINHQWEHEEENIKSYNSQ